MVAGEGAGGGGSIFKNQNLLVAVGVDQSIR